MTEEDTRIPFEIVNKLGVIKEYANKKKEFNRVSWNGKDPKYDIRTWDARTGRGGKGITLDENELRKLKELVDAEVSFLDEQQ